jgi:hypothetical protein
MRIVEGGGLARGEKEQWWQEQGRIYSTDFDFDYRSHYPKRSFIFVTLWH